MDSKLVSSERSVTSADPHRSLHSETGALRSDHPGRSTNPVVKVSRLAWLEFEKPDLTQAERFLADFGFVIADRTPDTLGLRGRWAGTACLVLRRGPRSRFVGPAFAVAERADIGRLEKAFGVRATSTAAGTQVRLTDPSDFPVTAVYGTPELAPIPEREPLPLNFGSDYPRANATQRPPRGASEIERLGHVVLGTSRFATTLDWYLDTFGFIVSDFLYLDGLRERGPSMAFIRCDLGTIPSDHHTLAIALQPVTGYVHSAYQVTDLDAVAAGGEFLRDRGYRRSWGIGRHIQGSQIFDYWRDGDGLMFEHYADGDVFDSSAEPGWAPMSASGLAQWGPKATRDFLGVGDPATVVAAIKALTAQGNDIDLPALRALVKAMSS